MTKKEQFLAFVLVGALAQDYATQSNDLPLMMRLAAAIPEEEIPDNPMNAQPRSSSPSATASSNAHTNGC